MNRVDFPKRIRIWEGMEVKIDYIRLKQKRTLEQSRKNLSTSVLKD